jgi:uncharacterized protein with von Willebrand factor type A (vWA) domain
MYPFGGFPENLVAFCAFLRTEHRFDVGPGTVLDAARALDIVDLTDERGVRDALRPVLSGSVADAGVFDRAFTHFFFPGPPGVPQPDSPAARRQIEGANGTSEREGRVHGISDAVDEVDEFGSIHRSEPTESQESRVPASLAFGRYSPLEAETASISEIAPVGPAWRSAARTLVRRVQLGLARRWRPAASGPRFDLRRTLRASLQTGGEPLIIRWLARPRRAPRFVILIDGSQSMAQSAATALKIAVAVASVTMRVDAFAFSTGLECVTAPVCRAAAGESLRIGHLQHAWGGGTLIGACLRDFLRRFGSRLLGRDTLVLIASDGLDVGDLGLLREALREIRRRSAGVVWLNPLLETAGYEPTASGMVAARPYITTFASVADASGLARLAGTVTVR